MSSPSSSLLPSPAPGPDPRAEPVAGDQDPHKPDDLGFALPPPARLTRARALGLVAAILVVLAAAFLLRWVPMQRARRALEADTGGRQLATPRVQVITPVLAGSDRALSLPGSVQPLEETIVYPRAGGYVRRWLVDLGDKVKEGDLLAEIDTPDLDQQLVQARAQLAQADAGVVQAQANARFSKLNLARYQELAPEGLASQQDLEKQRAQAEVDQAIVSVASASVGSQRANVQLLTQLKSFSRVVAPFAGTVTARSVERGALVSAGTATPLFKIAALDPVRVFVQVPQDVAPSVRSDVAATVTLREYPGRAFEGRVARSAGALDATTRTMTTEVRVPNPKGELMAGMYAQVSLTLPTPHRALAVPATALLNDAGGQRVAVVGAGERIRLVPVVVERDTGPTIEIASGLAGDERVVRLPGPELTEGRLVEVAP